MGVTVGLTVLRPEGLRPHSVPRLTEDPGQSVRGRQLRWSHRRPPLQSPLAARAGLGRGPGRGSP